MSFEFSYLLAVKRVDIDSRILRSSSHVLVIQEVNAQNRVTMIGLNSFQPVQLELLAPFDQAALLVGIDPQFGLLDALYLLAASQLFDSRVTGGFHFLETGVYGVVRVELPGLRFFGDVEFLQDASCVVLFLSFAFHQSLGCDNVIRKIVEDFLDERSEVMLHILQFLRQLFLPIEGALSSSDEYQLIRQLHNGFQLLFLQFPQIPVNLIVPHLFGILLDLADQVLVGHRSSSEAIRHSSLIVHQDLPSHQSQLLDFSLDLCVFGDVCLVNEVELCLNRDLDIFEDVVDLSPEHGKVILYLGLFPLYFFLEVVDVLLLIAEQKDQVIGKDIGMFGHHVVELRDVAAGHRHPRPREVVLLAHGACWVRVGGDLRGEAAVAFVEVVGWEVGQDG